MTTLLLVSDSVRSPAMLHEIGERIADPVIFIEHDDKRIVVTSRLDAPRLESREDVVDEVWNNHDLGIHELVVNQSFPRHLIDAEITVRALEKLGAFSVTVPGAFPVQEADYLRDKGVEVVVDEQQWGLRRRRKTPWEIEGIERAQRAADTAMLTAARLLHDAERTGTGQLRFEGEILTAELIRTAMEAELLSLGAESDQILVHSGDAALSGHDVGTGPILPDVPCIIDCFPRDRRTGCNTDMTRTYVPGTASDEVKSLHAHCRKALDIALESLRPGTDDAFRKVSEYFESQGLPNRLHHEGNEELQEGFNHALGHGVGLEVHERPWMGERSDELVEGDVVAVEPGLYFAGVGGVRLEDTVLVTDDGPQHFSDPIRYDLEP